ncbi:hypothetical protein [Brevibacillus borstelensis]|uniref:hypothetical protein n=1 Tax=Brevibacillus borstelensis TaxID=45462 RepID=UPI0018CC748F
MADHAFSVACNAYGKTSLRHLHHYSVYGISKAGDRIVARVTEVKRNVRTGFYRIDICHEENLIATMEAVSYRKDHYFVERDEQK